MNVQHQTISKLRISDVPRLDPVNVYVERVRDNAGHLTLTCFGKAWTAYWGNTGMENVTDFIISSDIGYLASCLQPGIEREEYDPEEALAIGKRRVLHARRARSISKEQANDEYNELAGYHMEDDPWQQVDVMHALLGENWLERLPMRANPDYVYLTKIIDAVCAGLKQHREAEHA